MTRDGHVMSFVPFERIRVVHAQDLLALVSDHHHARPGIEALLGACFLARDSALRSTLRIADPALYSFRFVLIFGGNRHHHQEHHA